MAKHHNETTAYHPQEFPGADLRYRLLLKEEMSLRTEQGCDVAAMRERIEGVKGELDHARCLRFFEELAELPAKYDESNEPSDYARIAAARPAGPRTIPLNISHATLRSKLRGAWNGRVVGCLLGKPVEGWDQKDIETLGRLTTGYPLRDYLGAVYPPPTDQINPRFKRLLKVRFSTPGYPAVRDFLSGGMPVDDDTNYPVLNTLLLERRGARFTTEQVGDIWHHLLPFGSVGTAERIAYRNLANNMAPPACARFMNPGRELIGAQIRADAYGFIAPGMPEKAAAMGFKDACLSHVQNGIYGEMWVAAMLAAAFAVKDVFEVIEIGLSEIPADSRLTKAIRKIVGVWKKSRDWEKALTAVDRFYGKHLLHEGHTINNAAVVAIGLLEGREDFERGLTRSVMCGYDADCNGATVGAILGMRGSPGMVPRIAPDLLGAGVGEAMKRWLVPRIKETSVEAFSRRDFMKTIGLGAAASVLSDGMVSMPVMAAGNAGRGAVGKPNILLITTDEQRFDTYGAIRSDWPQLPNLSRLRNEGTTLTNAYSNCPICMPCRYSWLTGLYGSQTERGPVNGYDWPDYHKTMPQALQKAGYHTAVIGKVHAFTAGTLDAYHLEDLEKQIHVWGYDTVFEASGREMWCHGRKDGTYGIKGCRYTDYLRNRGLYDKALKDSAERSKIEEANNGIEPYRPGILGIDDTLDGFIVREMCNFVKSYDKDKPFFLHASFFAPHYPLDVPPEYFNMFRPEDMPPPAGVEDPVLIRRWQENRAMYMALATIVDEQIGKLLKALEEKGILDETIIIMTTDHGDMLGDRNKSHKFHPEEGSCRTPIIVRYPRLIPKSVTLSGLAESVDVPHTILAVAGLSAGDREQALPASPGLSFWDYCRNGGATFRDSAFAEVRGEAKMLRRGDWKYVRVPGKGGHLFNLSVDPYELTNLIDSPDCASTLREMQEALMDRIVSVRVPPLQGKFRGDEIMKRLNAAR
ncbi:MAG: sulfatase-like hydrolase/transferase [Lentisphaerae bacterium]|nr:sulfatase-like hydrolase/transferase [Lentisphaerota bacterium]